jgi:hypothetical protein
VLTRSSSAAVKRHRPSVAGAEDELLDPVEETEHALLEQRRGAFVTTVAFAEAEHRLGRRPSRYLRGTVTAWGLSMSNPGDFR